MGRGKEIRVPRCEINRSRPDYKERQLRSDRNLAKRSISDVTNDSVVYLPRETCLCGGEGTYAEIIFKNSIADVIKPRMMPYCEIIDLMPTRCALQFMGHQLQGSLKEMKQCGYL